MSGAVRDLISGSMMGVEVQNCFPFRDDGVLFISARRSMDFKMRCMADGGVVYKQESNLIQTLMETQIEHR